MNVNIRAALLDLNHFGEPQHNRIRLTTQSNSELKCTYIPKTSYEHWFLRILHWFFKRKTERGAFVCKETVNFLVAVKQREDFPFYVIGHGGKFLASCERFF